MRLLFTFKCIAFEFFNFSSTESVVQRCAIAPGWIVSNNAAISVIKTERIMLKKLWDKL